jgi:hypothetical protein
MEKIRELLNKLENGENLDIVDRFELAQGFRELIHFKDAYTGLYCMDCHPSELLEKLNNSQSDAHSLPIEDLEDLNKDWIKFVNNENFKKSPFIQLDGELNELNYLEIINDLCIQSLPPDLYENWVDIKESLIKNRRKLKINTK